MWEQHLPAPASTSTRNTPNTEGRVEVPRSRSAALLRGYGEGSCGAVSPPCEGEGPGAVGRRVCCRGTPDTAGAHHGAKPCGRCVGIHAQLPPAGAVQLGSTSISFLRGLRGVCGSTHAALIHLPEAAHLGTGGAEAGEGVPCGSPGQGKSTRRCPPALTPPCRLQRDAGVAREVPPGIA